MRVAVPAIILAGLLTSCDQKENQQLVDKFEAQREAVESLQKELQSLDLQIAESKVVGEDPDLITLKKTLMEAREQKEEAEEEISALKADLEKKRKILADYQAAYPISE